jgi:hypothetical protein
VGLGEETEWAWGRKRSGLGGGNGVGLGEETEWAWGRKLGVEVQGLAG